MSREWANRGGGENSGHCSKRGYSRRAVHGSAPSTDAEMNKNVCPFIRVQHSDPFAFDWARSFHGSPGFTRFSRNDSATIAISRYTQRSAFPPLLSKGNPRATREDPFLDDLVPSDILFPGISTIRENMDALKYGNISYLELWNISTLYTRVERENQNCVIA